MGYSTNIIPKTPKHDPKSVSFAVPLCWINAGQAAKVTRREKEPVMNDIILVRHGEAQHMVGVDDQQLTGGWTDSELTPLGRQQAHATGQALSLMVPPQYAFYSSDLSRARETAEIIGDVLHRTPRLTPELRELNNGRAAGLTRQAAEALRLSRTEPALDWTPYPDAESWGALHDRINSAMDRIAKEALDAVLIVSHAGSIAAIIHWWLELPRSYYSRIGFDIDPCSVSRLGINRFGEKTIVKLNDTGHLTVLTG